MLVQRVEKHQINFNSEYYSLLDNFCFMSKNLYNYANYQVRQCFIICSKLSEGKEISKDDKEFLNNLNLKVDEYNNKRLEKYKKDLSEGKKPKEPKELNHFGKDNKFIGYEFNDFLCKGYDYSNLPVAASSQQCLKLLEKNWKSFFEGMKKWKKIKDSFSGMPKLPKYKNKSGREVLILTNIQAKLKDGVITFPKSFNGFTLKTNVDNLQQIRILPRNKYLIVEVVYNYETKEISIDNNKYISIDIGLDNLATITNNCDVSPIIISGRKLKSINKYYNKEVSHYREIAKRLNNLDYTKKMNSLTIKRNNLINDLIHKASKSVVNYALSCGANTIIIGNNKDWKRESKLSKKVNQSFVGIPHEEFIKKISYKAENIGLNVIITEESYTSGTSFLDNELPIKDNYNKSRRVFRGLFKSNKGILINADVNGAYQIMKKVFPNVFTNGIEGAGLHPIRVGI